MGEGLGGGEKDRQMVIDPKIATIAKNLRKRTTEAENLLWRRLRGKQIEGFKFRRQEPIGSYIVDFVCFEKKIIVELDGSQHAQEVQKENDSERTEWLEKEGFKVLRFWNNEVSGNIEGVLETIRKGLIN